MEYEDYLKIGSGPFELMEERWLKWNHMIQLKIIYVTEVHWIMEFSKDQF
jgi:hypothetical protein